MIPPGYHTHDGFYMRLSFGVGGAATSGAGVKYSGGSLAFGAAFGGAITRHLVLYGEFFVHTIPNPTVKGFGSSQSLDGTEVDILGFGPGVAYYFMPLNLYLSGTLLLQQVQLSDSNDSSNSVALTNTGIGCSLMVGKEWWVSADWGIGVAAQLLLGSAKDHYSDARWTSRGVAIMFSSTYN
jgi:hypothetical protein